MPFFAVPIFYFTVRGGTDRHFYSLLFVGVEWEVHLTLLALRTEYRDFSTAAAKAPPSVEMTSLLGRCR